MDFDNNGMPLPKGYGLSFDYGRTDDDEDDGSMFKEPKYFYLISWTETSEQILNWVNKMCNSFASFERRVERIKGDEAGAGGTYYCLDSRRERVAVFKPYDEEPKAVNNPHSKERAKSSSGLREGTKVEKGAAREIAAYLLDHPTKSVQREGFVGQLMGFCGVPPTVPVLCIDLAFKYPPKLLECEYSMYKFGSLQMYMKNSGDCENIGERDFRCIDLQKIFMLDILFANADRNPRNLLFKKEDEDKLTLIPIDHGYCFPEIFACDFYWLGWNKSKEKFEPEIVEYINSLNSKKDIDLLIGNKFIMSHKFARTLHISKKLLQEGVKRELSPLEIGHFMCKEPPLRRDGNVRDALSSLVGKHRLGEESALQKIVSDSIKEFVREKLVGSIENVDDIVKEVDKESKLRGHDMTKSQVEEELLKIVFKNLSEKIGQYANSIRG